MDIVAALILVLGAQDSKDPIRIAVADVPADVAALVKKFVPGGTISEASKLVKDNEQQYQLKILVGTKLLEAEFDVEDNDPPEGSIEEPVVSSELPKAVADAFRKALPEQSLEKAKKITEIDKDVPEGEVRYEWRTKKPKLRVEISADGATTRIREKIQEADLPPVVRAALSKDFADVKVKQVEKILLNGELWYYFDVQGGDDLVSSPDGKITVEDD